MSHESALTAPAPSFNAFLVETKEALRNARKNTQTKTTLVLGNERADLDTIASANILAYFRTTRPPPNAWSPIYIPAINEMRTVLRQQPILMRVLNHSNIAIENLIAVEDMVTEGTQSGLLEDVTKLFFVDHNLTLGRQKQNYSHRVIGCIDHNPDEGYVPINTDPEPRVIAKAGSCTSLVVNFCRKSWEVLEFEDKMTEVSLAKLALAAILVDTKDGRFQVTNEDIAAVVFLVGRLKAVGGNEFRNFDRTDYYYQIIGEERPGPTSPNIPQPVPAPEPVRVQYGPEPPPREPTPPPREPTPPPREPTPPPREPTPPPREPTPPPREPTPPPREPTPPPREPTPPPREPTPPPREPTPEPLPEPIVLTKSRPRVPRVYLKDVLAHDFDMGYEGGGAIGITFTPMGLAEMIIHAERDLVERAIDEASAGPDAATNGEIVSDHHIMRGTPFTAAVREFALERGLAVYAIRTDIRKGNELFIWVFENSMAYFIPRFVQTRAVELGLERWGTDEDEISKEAGMKSGMMAAFWIREENTRESVKKAVKQATTYIFFGAVNGNGPSSPPVPPRPRRGWSAVGKQKADGVVASQ